MGDMHDIVDAVDSIRVVVREGESVANSLFFQSREWHISGAQITGHPPQTAPFAHLESEEEF